MSEALLEVQNLRTYFNTPRGVVKAVDDVSFSINKGETLAIVGESGCGKSITALSLLQLVPEPAGFIQSGRVIFMGRDLLDLTWDDMRVVRGQDIGMIFQEPMTSLNPVYTAGQQLVEAMTVHGVAKDKARKRSLELLELVRMDDPRRVMDQYPHQLSGGMRQRVMIAIALANNPDLLIADEPTTALDVTVQAQILELLSDLQREFHMAVLLISHDLGIVAEMANHVAVMYAGEIVEYAAAGDLYRDPKHPYTRCLFASLPSREHRGQDLVTLEGRVPDPTQWPPGCRFTDRCPSRFEPCPDTHPILGEVDAGQNARCLLYDAAWPHPRTAPNPEVAR